MRRTPLLIAFIIAWFGLIALACNLGSSSGGLPPTLVPRVTDTPLPTLGYATLSPEELPQAAQVQQPVSVAPAISSSLQTMLSRVESDRLFLHIDRLTSFRTRHVNSRTDLPDQGIGAAYRYVRAQFEAIQQATNGSFAVTEQPFTVTWNGITTSQNNIIGILQGTQIDGGVIVLGAHYDSISIDPLDAEYYAPGANDNASGVAALLEIARIMSSEPRRATVMFVAFGAEEIGRLGSIEFVRFLQRNNITVDAMLNMDIIGSQTGPNGENAGDRIRVFSVGPNESKSRQLARAAYLIDYNLIPNMEILVQDSPDRDGRYGDHLSFSEVGFPAVRFIEAMEDRARQHTPQDTLDDIQASYLTRSTQTVLTVATVLADGLPSPRNISLRANANGTRTLVWEPVQGAVGYLIALRSPGSLIYNQQFTWAGTSVDWDGFVPTLFSGLAISAIDPSGLIGPPSPEYPIP